MEQSMKEKYAKMFFIGSLWNMFFAGLALVLPNFGKKLCFGFGKAAVNDSLEAFYKLTWALVFVYGIGYYIVSRNPEKNRGIVWMGILGKLGFFYNCARYFLKKAISPILFLGGFGDFLFSILFSNFLLKTRKDAQGVD